MSSSDCRFEPKNLSERVRSVVVMISSAFVDADPVQSPAATVRAAFLALQETARSAANDGLGGVEDAALIDMLADLRRLRAVTAAVEAQVQVAFDAAQRQAAMARGVPRKDAGKGIAEQIGQARQVSSYRAANDLALARGLVGELPATLSKLVDGVASEPAAWSVARETVCLMPEDRAIVDARIAKRITGVSGRRAASLTRAEAARVDAESVVRRIRQAEQDRHVSVRPAPDAMVYLSALLPVKEGIAAYAALTRHADTLRSGGDERSRGAVMADALVARLTGVEQADQIPVEVQLVMPASTLLTGADTAADGVGATEDGVIGAQDAPATGTSPELCGWIDQHPIPAEIACAIALNPDDRARRWIRRLFTDPVSGDVSAVDTKRRRFTGAVRRAIIARDRTCRSCDAPIRQIDHVIAYADGGATSMRNGQGLCQRCNQAKALPGWSARSFMIEGRHATVTKTPTGHRYVSWPPPPMIEPPSRPPVPLESRIGTWFERTCRRRPGPRSGAMLLADVVHRQTSHNDA